MSLDHPNSPVFNSCNARKGHRLRGCLPGRQSVGRPISSAVVTNATLPEHPKQQNTYTKLNNSHKEGNIVLPTGTWAKNEKQTSSSSQCWLFIIYSFNILFIINFGINFYFFKNMTIQLVRWLSGQWHLWPNLMTQVHPRSHMTEEKRESIHSCLLTHILPHTPIHIKTHK